MRIRLLSLALLMSLLMVSLASRGGTSEPALVSETLHAQAATHGTVRVIVRLNAPFAPEGQLASAAHVMSQRQALRGVQATVRGHLRGVRHRVVREFNGVLPLMAIEASPDALRMLGSLRGVVAEIHEDEPTPLLLAQSVPLINADDVWTAGFDGNGQIVAVLDTGVQKDHNFFAGGKVIAEACFSTNTTGVTSVCPGGIESAFGPDTGLPCAVNGCEHGTHVAGIAAGAGPSFSGVAKGAGIIAIQVFSQFNSDADCGGFAGAAPCIKTFPSDQIEALNYVHAQRQIFSGRIAAVNMSLGGGGFFGICDSSPQKLAIDQLRTPHPTDPTDPGVATVVAAGNFGFTDAISTPACISSAIPVASSTKTDGVSSFTNMASPTVFPSLLFAPGSSINSSVPPGPDTFDFFNGTSMAAPHVAGAFAVLRDATPTASVDTLLGQLKATGRRITDPRPACPNGCLSRGFTAPRIDLLAVIAQIGPPNLVMQTLTAPGAGVPGGNVSITASIRNVGVGPAAASNLKLYLSDDNVITAADRFLGTIPFGPLKGGFTSAVATLSVQIPPSVSQPGGYFVGAIADADAQRDETSETDNTKAVPIQVVLPDLTLPSVTFLPGAIAPGGNISVTHTVRNVAVSPANAPASTSGIYLGANQSLGSAIGGRLAIASVPTIAAGATSAAITTAKVNVPADTPVGRYYVLVQANDAAAFPEGVTGNLGASSTTLLVGPDLTVTTASTAAGISPGGNLSVTYTLKNQGGQAAGAFDVAFALIPQAGGPSRPLGPGRSVPGLAAGAMTTFTNVLAVPQDAPPAAYKLQVTTDSNSAVLEADEGNNAFLTGVVTVGLSDLAVQTVAFTPAATLPGGNVTVTHTMKNVAPAPGAATGSFSRLRMGPGQNLSATTDLGLAFVPPLAAGAMSTVGKVVQIPGNTSVGLYYLSANADDPGTLVELDDSSNNLRFSLTRLIVGPDMLPTAASTATGVAPGANVSVTYTLKNQGGQATNLDVVFALVPQPSGSPIALGPSRAISGFAAGVTTAFTNVVAIPSNTQPGSYRIRVQADPASDADPNNNSILTGLVNVVRPDLKVPSVTFAPAASIAGGNVTVTHTVKNVASPPGGAGATMTLLQLGATPTSSLGDLALVSVPPIAPGAMVTLARVVQIPSGTPPGLYYFLAAADAQGAVVEVNDGFADNLGTSQGRIIIGPDIVPTAATTLASVAPGANLSVSYTLKNQGGAAAGPFNVSFALAPTGGGGDVPLTPGRTGVTIPAGGTVTLTNAFVVPSDLSGPHRIRVIADSGDAVVEASETNNALLTAGTLNIVQPNLTVPPFTFSPVASAPNGTVTVLYSIRNVALAPGNAPASASRLFLSMNQTAIGEVVNFGAVGVPPIAAGMTVSGGRVVTLPSNLSVGRYFFGTQADPSGVILESDELESSNFGYSSTQILIGPDVVPTAATTLGLVAAGANLSVSYTLKNQGGASAGPFNVSFALAPVGGGGDIALTPSRTGVTLPAGGTATLTNGVTIPGSVSGPHRIRVIADSGNAVVEADETNNALLTAGTLNVVQPNLTVPPFTFSPAASAPNGAVTVLYSIKNAAPAPGNAAASASRLFLSVNRTAAGEVVNLGIVSVPPVAAGMTVSGSRFVTLPGNLSAGRYYFGTQANPTGAVVESDESEASNYGYSTTQIIIGPDLVPSAATTLTTVAAGANLSVSYTLKNQGGTSAGPFNVDFAIVPVNASGVPAQPDVPLTPGRTSVTVPAGGTVTFSNGVLVPSNASGLHRIRVIVDPGNAVVEADEGNNSLLTTGVLNVALADLSMQSVTATPAVLAPGANVSVTQVIKNLTPPPGGAPATTSRLYLSPTPSPATALSSPVIGDVAIPPIAGSATATVTQSLPLPPGTVPGKYWIYARANTGDLVPEGGVPEQINNLQRIDAPIVVGPDLTLTALTAPALASPSLSIAVSSTVKNQGGQGTNGSVVRFFLSQSGVLDGSEIPLGVTSTAALNPGASFTTTSRLTIPANTSAGGRFLLAQADGLGIAEADATNNVLLKTVNIQLPNLQVMSITTPAAVIRGRVTGAPSASVVIKNTGTGPAAPFDVQVFANRVGNVDAQAPGSGDLLFTRTVPSLLPNAMITVSGPIVIPEGTEPDVREAGNYLVSAVADPTGAATGDASLTDNGLTLLSKVLPVVPDMTRLHTAAVVLDLQPACQVPGNVLHLQGSFNATSQSVAAVSNFAGTATLDDIGQDFHVVYTITGTVKAVDAMGNPGVVAATFTYSGPDTSGSGLVNGAAPRLEFPNGTVRGSEAGAPACSFTGTINITR